MEIKIEHDTDISAINFPDDVNSIRLNYAGDIGNVMLRLTRSSSLDLSKILFLIIVTDHYYELPPKEEFADLLPNLISLVIDGTRWWNLNMDERVPRSIRALGVHSYNISDDLCKGMEDLVNLQELTLYRAPEGIKIRDNPSLNTITIQGLEHFKYHKVYFDYEIEELEAEKKEFINLPAFDEIRGRIVATNWDLDTRYMMFTLVLTLSNA